MQDLGAHAVFGAMTTLVAQVVKFALGVAITMILARVLTPHDYGLFAMAALFTGLVAIFRDGGLSVATVQKSEISHDQLSTLFWLNTGLGLGLALVMVVISPLVGWFYNEHSLVGISVALAIPFFLNGLGAQPQALLQRQLRFNTIAVIDVTSLVVSSAVGVAAAFADFGYWALVIMLIVASATTTILSCFSCRWRPSAPVRGAGVRAMLRFGGELTVMKFFDNAAASLDSLLLGKFFNASAVGMYSRAQSLMLLPSTQIVPPLLSVALPIMSRLKEDPPRLRQVFSELLTLVLLAASFITVMLVAASDLLVAIILGPQWTQVPAILSLLAGPALFVPLSAFCVASMTALAKGALLIRWALYKNIITVAAIGAGLPWGAEGVALSLSVASFALLLPLLNRAVVKSGLIAHTAVWQATGIVMGVCIVAILLLALTRHNYDLGSPLKDLVLLAAINALTHALAIWAWPRPRRAILKIVGALRRRATTPYSV